MSDLLPKNKKLHIIQAVEVIADVVLTMPDQLPAPLWQQVPGP